MLQVWIELVHFLLLTRSLTQLVLCFDEVNLWLRPELLLRRSLMRAEATSERTLRGLHISGGLEYQAETLTAIR